MATDASWGVVQVQVPPVVTDLARVLDDLVGALIAVLDVVRAVLDVVKAFLVGFIDPLSAIIDAIVSEIESLLDDIRQVGVYFAGDLDVEPPFEELLGGFTAYERRMVGRLVDRTDPTRPAFSTRSAVAAVFLYASFDTTTVQQALAFISQLRKFFHLRGRTRTYTIPTGLNVSYGSSSTGLGAFGLLGDVLETGEAPSVASVRWQMTPPAGAGAVSWPLPSPPGFLVEVSTVPDGLFLAYQTPTAEAQADDEGNQHLEVGLVSDPDGNPFKLYGGLGIIDAAELDWESIGTNFEPPEGDGKTRLFLYRSAADNVPIPLNALSIDGKPVLQTTFFVDVKDVLGINVAAPGQQFSTLLRYEDMPYDATFESSADGSVNVTVSDEPARDVYVRVSAVTSDVVAGSDGPASNFYWTLTQSRVRAGAAGAVTLGVSHALPTSSKSDPSAPLKVTFPSTQTADYLDVVATALAVMVLSRSDLVAQGISAATAAARVDAAQAALTAAPADASDAELSSLLDDIDAANRAAADAHPSYQIDTAAEATGLEDLARYLVPLVLGNAPGRFLKKNFPDVTTFRSKLRLRCRATANMLLSQTGPLPSSVLDLVLEQATVTTASGVVKSLAAVTWKDLDADFDLDETILGSMDATSVEGSDSSRGVAPNPVSVGKRDAEFLRNAVGGFGLFTVELDRAPGFLVFPPYVEQSGDAVGTNARMGLGSADYSPVIYQSDDVTTMKFCRNVFLANPSVLSASQLVLNVAASSATLAKKSGGEWTSYRLFPQGLPPVEAALNEIVGFLDAIKAGVRGIVDAVLAYIDFVEARILELEALLQRIEGLLDLVVSIEVPAVAGLVVAANGTDGVLQALVSADNKPSDSSAAVSRIGDDGEVVLGGTYGVGAVLLAGGLPAAVLDLLLLLFSEG
jgi:hypothetical protein